VAEPLAGEGRQIVEVLAAGLNPVDLLVASGTWYGGVPEVPYVPGSEGVGRFEDGRIVWFLAAGPPGSLAERCAIDPERSVRLPAGLDAALGAAIGIPGLAAWLALEWRAELSPGESVLVLGASGAVGMLAVQVAKLMGAGRVVAAARSQVGLDRATSVGADATVKIDEVENLAEALMEASGGGVDVTIDPLWGEPAAAAALASARGGRLIQLGQSAGVHSPITSAAIRGKKLSVLGYSNFDVPFEEQAAAYEKLAEHALQGRLTVDYETVALEHVEEAWQRQRDGSHRKQIIVP
jgi:NADPH2:quinone reductase